MNEESLLNVVLVSRRTAVLDELEQALRRQVGFRHERKLVVNGHVDPLHGLERTPDVLVLHLGETWRAELESLAEQPADRRPPLIVVGSAADANVMRLAMRAGAREMLPLPLVAADLVAALERIGRDRRSSRASHEATLTTFMNAKGGCGATLLACNVAHVLTAVSNRRVALVDLDMQFGGIPLYFDQFPKRGLLQALENADELDETALEGYLVKHVSGLKILGHAANDPLSLQGVPAGKLKKLLAVACRANEHVIIDLPRRIDPVTTLALEHARHVVLVVQQSIAVLRDATRLLSCMRTELGIPEERIVIAVNRYDKNAVIGTENIRDTLGVADVVLVPNDFRTVSECIEAGAPLLTHARGAAITKAVMALETRLGGTAARERHGVIARTFAGFMKSRSV